MSGPPFPVEEENGGLVSAATAPPVSREELWNFYREAGFLHARRTSHLGNNVALTERTWDRLLAAGDDIAWHDYDRVDGRLRSTCVTYRHTLSTRICQHWVTWRNPLGRMKTLMAAIRHFQAPGEPSRYFRSFFRPNNPLGLRFFRTLRELILPAAYSLRSFELIRASPVPVPASSSPPIEDGRLKTLSSSLLSAFGRIEAESEDLLGDDPLCRGLGRLYSRAGLVRGRAVFEVLDESGGWVSGLFLCDSSSFGLSLSGFNDNVRYLEFTKTPDLASFHAAFAGVKRFFAEREAPAFTIFLPQEELTRIRGYLGNRTTSEREWSLDGAALSLGGPCDMATLDLGSDYRDIITRHIQAFCEARFAMAKIVTDLSEEEVDWINDNSNRLVFGAGETLIGEGEIADALMLIQSGEVGVFRGRAAERKILAICRAPDVVGEIGVLQGVRRTASVIALTNVTALRVSKERLQEFFRIFPEGGRSMREALQVRLHQDARTFGEGTSPNDVEPGIRPPGPGEGTLI